jgi:hypothetical protein
MMFLSPTLAAAPAETAPASAVSVETALLLLLGTALLLLFRRLTQLHEKTERIEALLGAERRHGRSPAAAGAPGDPIPALQLAVIAASVHAMIDARHRIVSVEAAVGSPAWSIEGRRQVLHSHRLR